MSSQYARIFLSVLILLVSKYLIVAQFQNASFFYDALPRFVALEEVIPFSNIKHRCPRGLFHKLLFLLLVHQDFWGAIGGRINFEGTTL